MAKAPFKARRNIHDKSRSFARKNHTLWPCLVCDQKGRKTNTRNLRTTKIKCRPTTGKKTLAFTSDLAEKALESPYSSAGRATDL